MRRQLTALLSALALALGGSVAVAPAASAAPYCGQVWGSHARGAPGMSDGRLLDVRTGRHACFDRLVLDISAPLTGWSVRYVPRLVQDGSGRVVPVQGRALLEVEARVRVRPLPAGTAFRPEAMTRSYSGYRSFSDVELVSAFEGVSIVGLGVRGRLPFRAFVLPGPGSGSRLVVDVGHRWCTKGDTRC